MPLTRSHALAVAKQATLGDVNSVGKENISFVEDDDSNRLIRVVADQRQLISLNALHKLSLSRPLVKQDFLNTAIKTNLTEKWIRKWLTRRRCPRRKLATAQLQNADDTEVAETPPRDSISAATSISQRNTMTTLNISNPSMLDLLTDISLQSISAVRPEVSRAHSAPELSYRTSSTGDISSHEASLNYGRVYAQLLAKSPSLGYISTAFPRDVPLDADNPPSLSPSPSESTPGSASLSTSVMHDGLLAVPQLNLPPVVEDSRVEGMTIHSMLQLLQDSPIVPVQAYSQDAANMVLSEPSQSEFLCNSSAYGYKSTMLSFAPSLQSHSTSVMFNNSLQLRTRPSVSHNMSFQPMPMSFKARLSDLTALSKRIRAVSREESLLAAYGTQTDGSFTSDSSLSSIASETNGEYTGPSTPVDNALSLTYPRNTPCDSQNVGSSEAMQ